MRRLFIDGDAILWKVLEANQEETWWPDSETTRTAACNVLAAQDDYVGEVEALQALCSADEVTVVIGPPTREHNFRRKLWPAYKQHRRRADSPVGMWRVRQWLSKTDAFFVFVTSDLVEADDSLGCMMTGRGDMPAEEILWSPDKDMLQIPGLHLEDTGHIVTVTQEQADYQHLLQTLTGDTSDGYPGCKGIGPVAARKILDVNPHWEAVKWTYAKAGFDEDFALNQARVARILRFGEEPGQWTPQPYELKVMR